MYYCYCCSNKQTNLFLNVLGKQSREIRTALKLSNHIILFGCNENLPMFISELRREAVTGDSYHPIVIVAEAPATKWNSIKEKYNDIYFLRGDISLSEVFAAVNIEEAYSFILMCVKANSSVIDQFDKLQNSVFNENDQAEVCDI